MILECRVKRKMSTEDVDQEINETKRKMSTEDVHQEINETKRRRSFTFAFKCKVRDEFR